MVSKTIGLEQWHLVNHLANIAIITIHTKTKPITICNICNPAGATSNTDTLNAIQNELEKIPPEHEMILLGDFNLHHSTWGGTATTSDSVAKKLLADTLAMGLVLCTPRGLPTWRRGARKSVIDLTFLSTNTAQRLEHCGPVDE